jgi:hypothetical protein
MGNIEVEIGIITGYANTVGFPYSALFKKEFIAGV